jgi:O-antigen/teichoic acid export membrane protein
VFAFRSVDRIVLSRVLGTHSLGLYAFAYSIANLPATLFVRVLNTVLFPAYTSLGDDRPSQRSLYLRSTSYMSAAALLYAVGLIALGRYFLLSMYGDKWLDATAALYALAFFALFRALFALVGDLLVGTGHPNAFRSITGLQLGVAAAGLYFGARSAGIAGVALVMTVAQLVSLAVGWAAAGRILGLTPADYTRAVRGPIAAALAASAAGAAVVRMLPAGGNLLAFAIAVVATSAVFAAVWWLADRELRSEMRDLLRGRASA